MTKIEETPWNAETPIRRYFKRSKKRVYNQQELYAVFREERKDWQVPPSVGAARFVEFIVAKQIVKRVELESEDYQSKRRFIVGNATPYEVALSLAKGGYLSHGTAVFMHGLNDQIPKTIYVNREQSPKRAPTGGLTQERLNFAFSGRQRTSKYVFKYTSMRITLLGGKHSGRYGVVSLPGPSQGDLEVTSIGRTLVDIVVRPGYAGGIVQVLEAYKGAIGKVTGEEILRILGKLDYVYPYHQSIGFLLERAGFSEDDLLPFAAIKQEFDFYLVHGIREKEYSERWRLFYPKGF